MKDFACRSQREQRLSLWSGESVWMGGGMVGAFHVLYGATCSASPISGHWEQKSSLSEEEKNVCV